MAAILDRAGDRLQLLQHSETIAVVGMSSKSSRASHFVATYLLGSTDFDVYFVNPRETEIMGRKVYDSLADIPVEIDIVDVFRRTDDLPAVTAEAIAAGANAVWFQLGLENPGAASTAVDAGLDVVQNRCLKIEHARFRGGLHTAGFNTGVIDSRRTRLI
jgi:predicted CoA-binding protein